MDTLTLDLTSRLRLFDLALSLEVGAGETVALVGPSGAGKSTVLRAVAGLARVTGTVRLGEERWLDSAAGVDLPPERRSVGLVFQEYALFPHMSVADNVAFGGRERTDEVLERLNIGYLASERPGELSGGERQRVALARALARDPRVMLLDEPLSALDSRTRAAVRGELHQFLRETGLPTVLVTHDFEDAAALADRIGVVSDGRLLQVGTVEELLAAPADAFVAGFTGANLLSGNAERAGDGLTAVVLDQGGVMYTTEEGKGRVALAVYPWEVSLSHELPSDSTVNHLRASVLSVVSLGNRARVRIGPLVAEVTSASAERLALREGDAIVASFKATASRLLPLA
jgi:molybdate transport system ATP-binding protein